jgi:hypothetical protein
MGTITGTNLADKAALLLQDTTNIRWTTAEILGWINSAQREIVLYKPNASVLNANAATLAGTKQTIPSPGLQLLDVVRNMGTGSVPGRAITAIKRDILDVAIPDWHAAAGAALSVKHFMFDARDPKTYYVYPPLTDATQKLEIVMSTTPVDLVSVSSVIALDDIYETPIIDYILYRAYSKDSEHTANAQRALDHQKAFMQAVGGKAGAETAFAPKARFSTPTQQG